MGAKVAVIGKDKIPVLIVDNTHPNAESLCEYAAHHQSEFDEARKSYPGVACPVPAAYLSWLAEILQSLIKRVWKVQIDASQVRAEYSKVTLMPRDLSLAQRLPHYDNLDPSRFACVHYLDKRNEGGTSFYRHQASQFEMLTASRIKQYKTLLVVELESNAGQVTQGYIEGDTALFKRTFSCPAKFNRMVIYPSAMLHSGDILLGEDGSPLPRLSITGFT